MHSVYNERGILSFYPDRIRAILYETDWMVQAVNGKIFEYESLLYEAGETGFWSRSGNGNETGGMKDVDMSKVWAYL